MTTMHPLKWRTLGDLKRVDEARCQYNPAFMVGYLELYEDHLISGSLYFSDFEGRDVQGSWLSLLATQPPMQTMRFYLWRTKYRHTVRRRMVVRNEQGITFGDMLRQAQSARFDPGGCRCCKFGKWEGAIFGIEDENDDLMS